MVGGVVVEDGVEVVVNLGVEIGDGCESVDDRGGRCETVDDGDGGCETVDDGGGGCETVGGVDAGFVTDDDVGCLVLSVVVDVGGVVVEDGVEVVVILGVEVGGACERVNDGGEGCETVDDRGG